MITVSTQTAGNTKEMVVMDSNGAWIADKSDTQPLIEFNFGRASENVT
jgi:hypothetical protein